MNEKADKEKKFLISTGLEDINEEIIDLEIHYNLVNRAHGQLYGKNDKLIVLTCLVMVICSSLRNYKFNKSAKLI